MNKEKRLLKNIGLFTIGNASVKVLSFLLVPLYTNVLTTEEYGVYELIITTISLLIPITTLDISDATLRFSMESNVNKKDVYRISYKYCFIGFSLVVCLLSLNHFFLCVPFLIGNELLFMAIFLGTSIVGVLVSYSKGVDKVKDTAISGAIGAFVTIVLNIVLLVPLKMGIRGYFIATLIGLYIQVIYLLIMLRGTHGSFGFVRTKDLEYKMLHFSVPLIGNNVAWWINSALDRFIVSYIRGISENGIYSVGYKIPTIINTVQSLFHQAWTLSAIQEYETEEAKKYFITIYKNYNFLLVGMCGFLIIANKFLARIMYSKEFYEAWRFVPYLCIGFVFLGLSNYIGGIFNALKQPRIIAGTTIIGATVNGVLNVILIPAVGSLGAAIATCISYFVIWIFRTVAIKRAIGTVFVSARDIISYIVLLTGALYTIKDNMIFNLLRICMVIPLIILYRMEFVGLINKAKTYIKRYKR